MRRFIGRGVLLALAFGVAISCSSPVRDFGDAGAGASGAEAGGASASGGSPDARAGNSTGATAGTHAGGAGATSSTGGATEGGTSGAGGDEVAGAAGETSAAACRSADTRSCSADGALGPCAAGTETCSAAGAWGPCSVKPAASDTCAANDDDNCNGIVNEGCPCVLGQSRSCKDAGALGQCANGTQACTGAGVWGGCSVVPAAKDGCVTNQDDQTCNGTPNEGCTCLQGATRTCAQAGLVGKCAVAGAIETCSAAGAWGDCSVTPSAADTCVAGNNDNCTGAANEGCQCINGTTKACGACGDGTQVCTDGKTNTYGACSGAVLQPTTYYRDADGDGFGSAATATFCGAPPAGYSDQTGDCCDDGGDLAVAKTIFPGQTQFFSASTTVCNIGWNYNCSANGSIETSPPDHFTSCITGAASCTNVSTTFATADCGTSFCEGSCTVLGPKGTPCSLYCANSGTVMCH